MDVTEARAVLGVGDGDGWDVVRLAYRRRIAPPTPTCTARRHPRGRPAERGYAVLSRAKRAGAATPAPTPATTPPPAPRPRRRWACAVGGDTLLLAAPPDEAFALLLEAATAGNVSYVDRACAIFEVVVARTTRPARWWSRCRAGPTDRGGPHPRGHGAAGEPAARPRRRPGGGRTALSGRKPVAGIMGP